MLTGTLIVRLKDKNIRLILTNPLRSRSR